MLIESLEKKTKLAMFTVLLAVSASAVTCGLCFYFTMHHIQLFHQYFFNLSPDDEYLKWTFEKAMYLADESALRQKQAIEETGFYSQLLSSSAVETIVCDSIEVDKEQRSFKYYGTQMIKRRTNSVKRSIITVGRLQNVPRTADYQLENIGE